MFWVLWKLFRISTHALRVEGDVQRSIYLYKTCPFLPTPSA